jgi:hypothetical protein
MLYVLGAAIVMVPDSNGTVTICDDFSGNDNPHLYFEYYLLQVLDDDVSLHQCKKMLLCGRFGLSISAN